MVKTRRANAVRLIVLLACVLLASGSAATISSPGASARPIEGVTGPINEAVGAPVEEATETVTAPLGEVTGTVVPPAEEATGIVPQPVHEATETVAAPVHEATETVTRPVKEAGEAVKPPARHVTETVGTSPATAPVPVPAATGTAVHSVTNKAGSSSGDATESAGTVIHPVTARGGANSAAVNGGGPTGASRPETSGGSPLSPRSADDAGRPRPADDVFEAPSSGGAVGAPVPKWIAFVWPAIALTGPALDFVARWEQDARSLVVSTGARSGAGSGGGPVVAAVHASGGRPEARDSSSVPFPNIPYLLGHLPSDGPGLVLTYLILAVMLVCAALAAIRWENSDHRRQGPSR